jgi:hypothetical protein
VTTSAKSLAVVIRATDPFRVAEALRAAIGLGLRGAGVRVVTEHALPTDYPPVDRAVGTLEQLGTSVDVSGDMRDAIERSDAVEVWT